MQGREFLHRSFLGKSRGGTSLAKYGEKSETVAVFCYSHAAWDNVTDSC